MAIEARDETDRLLTDSELDYFVRKYGHSKTAIEITKAAQDGKTLKAVGEWLESSTTSLGDDGLETAIQALKERRMPE